MSTAGSVTGAVFFILTGGNIFSRYIEMIGLQTRLGLFLAIPALVAVTQILGSWVLQRTGWRRLFFFLFLGPPRLLWIAIVTVPLWAPESQADRTALLGGLLFLYFLTAGFGGPAWISWMRDIIPDDFRGRYFAYRSTLITTVAALWGILAGYILEMMGLSIRSFTTVYSIGVLFGLADIVLFLWVHHPKMEVHKGSSASLMKMVKAAANPALRRFLAVVAVWCFASSLGVLTWYFLMRAVGMEIFSMQVLGLFGTAVFLVFSLMWGHFIDHYGAKPAYLVTLSLTVMTPLLLQLAPVVGKPILYVVVVLSSAAVSGLNIASMHLLFGMSDSRNQAMTVALQAVVAGLVSAVGFMVCENVLFPFFKSLADSSGRGPMFHLMMTYLIVSALRTVSVILAFRLPQPPDKAPAAAVAKVFYTTNPVRAFYSMGRFLRIKAADLIGKNGGRTATDTDRWRVE